MATYFYVTSANCESNNLSLSPCALPLSVPDRGFLLCTLINTTIKYTPPTLGPPTWRGQLMWLTHMQIVHCQRCHIWFTVAIYTHLPSLGDAMAWPAGVNQGKGGETRQLSTSAQRRMMQHGQCVCLMLLIDFQSQLTGPSHSASHNMLLLFVPPHTASSRIRTSWLNLLSLLLHTHTDTLGD